MNDSETTNSRNIFLKFGYNGDFNASTANMSASVVEMVRSVSKIYNLSRYYQSILIKRCVLFCGVLYCQGKVHV